ncbi:DddA-like double-stranded DNA deaminase toxin [Actinokineospora sp. HUAS TT18]|uniref:DddA-like double-stranded DNA deaminase toxin n=1 Tax=Actinokineospora sp. HUAS TT18 TaxID=3447451 RepID=UPI003F523B67
MSVDALAAILGEVLVKVQAARGCLNSAATRFEEARQAVATATYGSTSPEALGSVAAFEEAHQALAAPFAALHQVENVVRAYLSCIGAPVVGGRAVEGRATVAKRAPDKASADVPIVEIDRLRGELPPPVVPSSGQKTHGRWVDADGTVHAEVSGADAKGKQALRFFAEELKARRIPTTVTDVEIKLAVHMRKNGIRSATLVVNNLPCKGPMGCDALVPVVLPPGYVLTVYGTDGFRREYRGGGTSKWVP